MVIWAFPLHLDMFIKWALTGVRYYILCSIKKNLAIFWAVLCLKRKERVFLKEARADWKQNCTFQFHINWWSLEMSIYSYMYLGYVVKRQDGSNCWRHWYVLNCKWRKWSSYRRTADETASTGISVLMRLPKAHWCVVTIYGSIRTKCHGSNSVDGNNTTLQWLNCTHIVFQFSGHFFFK